MALAKKKKELAKHPNLWDCLRQVNLDQISSVNYIPQSISFLEL